MDEAPKPKAKGGARPGAGRKPGLRNGEVRAVGAAGLRVPENASPEARALADEAFRTVVEVMRKPARGAGYRLQAASIVREEVCGPVAKKHQHEGPDGGPLEVIVKTVADEG